MANPKPPMKKVTIRMSESLIARLDEAVAREQGKYRSPYTRSDYVRRLIRAQLDQEEDLIGSKRHFRGQFRAQTNLILWMQVVMILLIVSSHSVMMPRLLSADERKDDKYPKTMDDFFKNALRLTRINGPYILDKLIQVTRQIEFEEE